MRVVDDLKQVHPDRDMILTIGAYDGVHRGHQTLLSRLIYRSRCKGYWSGLITFYPHPRAILQPGSPVQYLTTPGEKAALLERMGLDILVILNFTKGLASTPPRDFVRALCDHLRMRELWVGADFALGKDREGDIQSLRALGGEFGYELRVIETVQIGGIPVRSSSIRSFILKGKITEANRLLGRHYSLSGEVVRGVQRGRCLGFPTANLAVREERVIPANGVYATFAYVGADRYLSVTNIGVRPSFDGSERTIEVHLLDFDEDLYGQDLVVEFARRLRSERRFDSVNELIAQVRRDVERAREILQEERSMVTESYTEVWPMGGYEEIEHTADLALHVWGEDLKSLFVNAALGMFHLVGDCSQDPPQVHDHIKLEAPDKESLLVDWLNELLYLHEIHNACYYCFDIHDLTPTSIVADVAGNPIQKIRKGVKAATFHNLHISRSSSGYETTIVFDV